MLSHLTTSKTRSDVLAWYVTCSALGSTVGTEVAGRVLEHLNSLEGWTLADAYHALFWIYGFMGVVNALLVLSLTKACEVDALQDNYVQVPQEESGHSSIELANGPTNHQQPVTPIPPAPQPQQPAWVSWLFHWMGPISGPTLKIVYKLWILLAIDSLADGMVPYSLTNYYIDSKFHPSKSTIGDLTSISYFLTAIGGIFAGPLAKKIGLVNTMVFTHIPSSAAVLLFPLPQVLWMAAILLFVRAGLNNMDQAPRSALIAGVVRPEERTAVMGITSMLRTLAATTGPMVTGFLAGSNRFWVAFVAGGACRLTYDVGLWVLFVNIKLHQHELPQPDMRQTTAAERRSIDESDEAVASLAGSDDDDDKRRMTMETT